MPRSCTHGGRQASTMLMYLQNRIKCNTYNFPKKATPLTVYLMSVHSLIIPSPELETVITFYSLSSLQCLLIYYILPKCVWNLAIPFISSAIILALSLTWTIRALSQIPVFHPQCQQNYFPVKQIWSCYFYLITPFGCLFSSRIKAKFLSLTQPF